MSLYEVTIANAGGISTVEIVAQSSSEARRLVSRDCFARSAQVMAARKIGDVQR